jgi:hypothetical protein
MLETLTKEKKDEANPVFWGGNFHSVPGEGFYALQLYVAGDKAGGPREVRRRRDERFGPGGGSLL